jgi:GNAT superfamily N-acetyltransferase
MISRCKKCGTHNSHFKIEPTCLVEYDAVKCYSCGSEYLLQDSDTYLIEDSIIVAGSRVRDNEKEDLDQLIIRKAEDTDLDCIVKIYNDTIEDNRMYKGLNYSPKELQDKYLNKIYVAEQFGEIYGFFLIFDNGVWGLLDILCVAPDKRKLGVGHKMLSFIDRLAQDKSWRAVETFVEPRNFKSAEYLSHRSYKCYESMLYLAKFYKD